MDTFKVPMQVHIPTEARKGGQTWLRARTKGMQ